MPFWLINCRRATFNALCFHIYVRSGTLTRGILGLRFRRYFKLPLEEDFSDLHLHPPHHQYCPQCGKVITPADRLGSLTSFLLSDLNCSCRADRVISAGFNSASTGGGSPKQDKLCARCHKVIPDVKRVGSLTSFFFKDVRCQCPEPMLSTGKASQQSGAGAGRLETRFFDSALTQLRLEQRKTFFASTQAALSADAAAFVDIAPGLVIGGTYELLDLAGQGGMGSVYRARHVSLGRQCAVKFVAPSMVSRQTWDLLQKEAKIISSLTHPTICQIYDLGVHAGRLPFYAMDFIEGFTLDEFLTKYGPLSVGACAELYIKVCEGLSYAHRRGVVHKDLKPANIMIERLPNDEIQVRILDFGISELNGPGAGAQPTKRGEAIGTAAYMSPEQFSGQAVDKRSDIYSLGASIFETLTGSYVFNVSLQQDALLDGVLKEFARQHQDVSPPSLRERTGVAFTPEIEAIVAFCLEKDPDNRYQNASELSIDLQRMLEGKPLQFAKTNADIAMTPVPARAALNWRPIALCLAGLALMSVGGYLVFVPQQAEKASHKKLSKHKEKTPDDEGFVNLLDDEVNVKNMDARVKDAALNSGSDGYFAMINRFDDYAESAHYKDLSQMEQLKEGDAYLYVPGSLQEFDREYPLIQSTKFAGFDFSRFADPLTQVQKLTQSAPDTEYFALSRPSSELLKLVSGFKRLRKLTVTGSMFGMGETIFLPATIDNLSFTEVQSPVFAAVSKDAPLNCHKALFKNCIVSADTVKTLAEVAHCRLLVLENCKLSPATFKALGQIDEPMKLVFSFSADVQSAADTAAINDLKSANSKLTISESVLAEKKKISKSTTDKSGKVLDDIPLQDQYLIVGQGYDASAKATGMIGPVTAAGFTFYDPFDLKSPVKPKPGEGIYHVVTVLKDEDLSTEYKNLSTATNQGADLTVLTDPDKQLQSLLKCCPQLKYLSLKCPAPSTSVLIAKFKNLERLSMHKNAQSAPQIQLVGPLPYLVFHDVLNPVITMAGAQKGKVKRIRFNDGSLDVASIRSINRLAPVEMITLANCDISSEAMKTFAEATNKYTVDIRSTVQKYPRLSAVEKARVQEKVHLTWTEATSASQSDEREVK